MVSLMVLILTTTSVLCVLIMLLFILKTEQQQNVACLLIRDIDSITKEKLKPNLEFQIEWKKKNTLNGEIHKNACGRYVDSRHAHNMKCTKIFQKQHRIHCIYSIQQLKRISFISSHSLSCITCIIQTWINWFGGLNTVVANLKETKIIMKNRGSSKITVWIKLMV